MSEHNIAEFMTPPAGKRLYTACEQAIEELAIRVREIDARIDEKKKQQELDEIAWGKLSWIRRFFSYRITPDEWEYFPESASKNDVIQKRNCLVDIKRTLDLKPDRVSITSETGWLINYYSAEYNKRIKEDK